MKLHSDNQLNSDLNNISMLYVPAKSIIVFLSFSQSCGSGSGSARIRTFLSPRIRIRIRKKMLRLNKSGQRLRSFFFILDIFVMTKLTIFV